MEGHVTQSILPLVATLLPIAASLFVAPIGRRSERLRDAYAVVAASATFIVAALQIPAIAEHHVIGAEVPILLGHITFRVDSFGMLFGLFTSFVWMLSTLYATSYMQHERKRDRYHTANLAVLGANMGVVLAGDLITLYLFFEALGLAAYWLVTHTETDEAKAASIKYLWMTVLGGFALIAGIFCAYGVGSTGVIGPIEVEEGMDALRWAAAILMILGFGVKAGMLPVHIWLPDAHPVAPSPASALLSGIMIKAGAYGIFRVVTALFRPPIMEEIEEHLWTFTEELGLVVLWIGMATMFVGVVLALLQENAKRMLAYHSVSQMGFILAGIGAAGYLGAHGAMGFAGGLYHIVNHALFKALLFLGVGAVFFRTHELNMYKLGGLWKKMPLTFLFTLIAAFGITGMPLFNGFVSKCLIHHAIVEAYEYHELFSLKIAEYIYIITCGGTACSFIKLISFVFLGKAKRDISDVVDAPRPMLVAMGAIAIPITVLGLAPRLLLEGVFTPGLHTWGLHAEILEEFVLFTPANLTSVAYAAAIGFTVFFVGVRTGIFHLHGPHILSVDYWAGRLAHAAQTGVAAADHIHDAVAVPPEFYADIEKAITHAHGPGVLSVDFWAVQIAHLTRVACAVVARWYALWLAIVSRNLIRSLRRLRDWSVHTGRRWRRTIVTLSTGAPTLRQQQSLETVYVIIERERHATVRHAVTSAVRGLRSREDVGEEERRQIVAGVREIASYMATRLFDERMTVLGDLLKRGRVEPVMAALESILPDIRDFRQPVADTALALAEPRMRGQNVVREMSHAMNHLMSEERFDLLMQGALPSWRASIAGGMGHGETIVDRITRSAYRIGGLTTLERVGRWVTGVSRVIAEAVVHEHVPWAIEKRVERADIAETRLAIQRYVRDISLNVSVIVAILLAFLLAVVRSL